MPVRVLILVLGVLFFTSPSEAQQPRGGRRVVLMQATAFAAPHRRTASGLHTQRGIVAADPRFLPIGTLIRISGTGGYDGTYLVADTGGAIRGRRLDLCVPTVAEARRFGRRTVRVRIERLGNGAPLSIASS